MDFLTQRIINELRKDGRASFTQIARELGTNRESVAQRVNPLIQSGELLICAGIHPRILGKNVSVHLLIRVGGALDGVVDALVEMEDTVFVSESTGAFQIVAELHTDSLTTSQRYISQIRSLPAVLDVNVHVYQQILSSFFLGPEPDFITARYDKHDLAIMNFLKRDGRAPLKDIADTVGLSPAAIRSRIIKLQSKGIMKVGALKQRSDMSNDVLFGLGINTFGNDREVIELLLRHNGLEFLARAVGRFDYIVTANFNNLREFNDLVSSLRKLPAVTYTEQWLHVRIGYERY